MDIYVESNFVLELALTQEQHESCKRIIELSEEGKVSLVIPAYSLVEPYETLTRYSKERARVSNDLASQVRQLSRSKNYQDEMDALQEVSGVLARRSVEEKERFRNIVDRLLTVAEVIPLNTHILLSASKHQLAHKLSLPDAIVYASVLSDLNTSTSTAKCFLNRNSKDFDDPVIEETLDLSGCKMLFSFDQGYRYIASQTRT